MADAVVVTKIIEVDVKASANASQHLQEIANSTKGIQDAAEKSGGALQQLTGWVKGFVGFQIFQMIGEHVLAFSSALQQASDQSKVLEQRMKLVTHTVDDASIAFKTIIDISIRQGRELDGVAKLYERLTRSSEQLGITQRGVAIITEGVAASLRLAGASTQEANAAMTQFSQALASGKLGGDEFRSMMENDSVLMQAFAKELGTTMGGLRQMSKEGKIGPEEMRKALLDMGEDGKNVMMRMIEQAGHLPKTWDQAVNGIKGSLVDLINALQQTGDKSEGIFTKIVMSLTASIRESAQLIRDQALVNEEIAKLLDKQNTPKTPEEPFESKRMRIILEKKDQAEALLKSATAGREQYEKIFSPVKSQEEIEKSVRWKMWTNQILSATGALTALNKQIGDMSRKDEADLPGGGFKIGKAEGLPPKTPKTKPTTDRDIFENIREELEKDAGLNTARLLGLEEWQIRSEALIEKLNKVKSAMSAVERKAAEDWIKRQLAQNEQDELEIKMRALMQKAVQTSDERVLAKANADHAAAIERVRQEAGKTSESEDPFSGTLFRVDELKKLMFDPATTDADAQMIADWIQELMHKGGEKAAKQLLGEKEVLRKPADLMVDSWKSAFGRMEEDLLDFSKSAKEIVGNMVLSILKDFARIQLKKQLDPLMEQGGDFLKKLVTDYVSLDSAANGRVFAGPGRQFGFGDVVNQPTSFGYNGGRSHGQMGEAGAEAIMPLARDRSGRLGVGTAPVNVIVNNNVGGKTNTEDRTNSKGEREVVITIEKIVEGSLGSGRFDNTMGKSFGIARKGT